MGVHPLHLQTCVSLLRRMHMVLGVCVNWLILWASGHCLSSMSEKVSSSRVQYRENYAKYAVIRRDYTSNFDSYTSISNWICIEDAAQWYSSCG